MIYADVGETTKIMAYFTSKLSNFNLKSTQINSNFNSNWLNITKYILQFFSFGNCKFESLEIGNFQLFQISKFPTFSTRFTHFITKKRAIFNDKTYLNWPNNLWQIYYLGKSLYVFFLTFFLICFAYSNWLKHVRFPGIPVELSNISLFMYHS